MRKKSQGKYEDNSRKESNNKKMKKGEEEIKDTGIKVKKS